MKKCRSRYCQNMQRHEKLVCVLISESLEVRNDWYQEILSRTTASKAERTRRRLRQVGIVRIWAFGKTKHVDNFRGCSSSCTPWAEILFETVGSIKHTRHIAHTRNVPGGDIGIESDSITKHVVHVYTFRNVPPTDGLIERGCSPKASVHASDIRYVPARNIDVERSSSAKL